MVRPGTTQLSVVVWQGCPLGVAVTVYPVTGEPPVDAGTSQDTVTRPSPATTDGTVGADGTVTGVTAVDGADAGPVPMALVAVTVNVYGVPLVRPCTKQVKAVVVVQVSPPGSAVTVYLVMAASPAEAGGAHATVTSPSPASPDSPVGAEGTVAVADRGVAIPVVARSLLPMALTATTAKECATPLVRPDTVHDRCSGSAEQPGMFPEPRPSRTRTSYDVIVEPPSAFGAVHDTTTLWSPAIAVGSWGGRGFVMGVANTAAEAGPTPTPFVAETLKGIDSPGVRPLTTHFSAAVLHPTT